MSETDHTAREFKASDLLRVAGLTYRQLHDWDNRAGVLTSQRATDAGWRESTGEEFLTLCVCASLRQKFALPLEKVGLLARWLLGEPSNPQKGFVLTVEARAVPEGEDADLLKLSGTALDIALEDDANRFRLWQYLQAEVEYMNQRPILSAYRLASIGFAVYLFTDFVFNCILKEEELARHLAERSLSSPVILCPLNAIFDDLRAKLGLPLLERDTFSPSLFHRLQEMQERPMVTESERIVLRLIRNKAYQRVTIHKRDGGIIRADADEDLSKGDAAIRDADIIRAIKDQAFSTVTVRKANGQIIGLTRNSTVKFDRVTGKT